MGCDYEPCEGAGRCRRWSVGGEGEVEEPAWLVELEAILPCR